MHGPVKVLLSRVFRDRAEECRTMGELFRSGKTREHLLKVAADYENMSDRAAFFELQDADREAGVIPLGTVAQRVTLLALPMETSKTSRWRAPILSTMGERSRQGIRGAVERPVIGTIGTYQDFKR